ncbi:MAG: hypothetical protein HWE27_18370 [Gammaproteobacteria bacterium]|nr:hypothetical protein [Gammaproteobacteria bacterium]
MSVVNRMLKDLENSSGRRKLLIDVGDAPSELQNKGTRKIFLALSWVFVLLLILTSWYFFSTNTSNAKMVPSIKTSAEPVYSNSYISNKVTTISTENSVEEKPVQKLGNLDTLEQTQLSSLSNEKTKIENSLSIETDISAQTDVTTPEKNNLDKISMRAANSEKKNVKNKNVKNENVKSKDSVKNTSKISAVKSDSPIKVSNQQSKLDSVKDSKRNDSVKQVSNAQQVDNKLIEAESLIKRGLLKSAEKVLFDILKIKSSEHRAAEQIAFIYLQSNEHTKLESFLEGKIKKFPEYTQYQVLLARYYAENNQWQRVILLTNRPFITDEMLLVFRTLALQRTGKHNAAIELYGELLKQQPKRGDWWIGLSISLSAMGQNEQSLQALNRAKNDPRLTVEQRRYIDSRLNRRG